MKVFIAPTFRGEDSGDGGMRRVIDAQVRHLPAHGWDVTDDMGAADVVNLHGTALIKQALNEDKPIVGSSHGLYWTGPYEWDRWAHHANRNVVEICRVADEVTAPSNWVANTLRRNLYKPVHVVYHGIEPEEWPEPGDPKGYVLWNKARVDPVSDPAPLDAVTAALPDVPFVSTFGTARENVQIVNVRGDKDSGAVPYDQAKAMVMQASAYLATTRETFGIGTLEAMAAGVPIVGYAWGGQREFIEQDVTGVLVPPGDTVQLAQAIRYVLENRDRLGAAAREQALERWAWADRIAPYAEVFARALDRPWRGDEGKRVSIVVPVRNGADTVAETIASAFAGMGDEDELLVGINPSDDNTADVVQEALQQEPGKAWSVEEWPEDVHLSGNRNNLIAKARGRFVLPLDADDQLQPFALEFMAQTLEHDRQLDVVYAGVEFVEQDGERWHSGWPVERFDLHAQVVGKNQIPYASMMRTDVVRWRGGYRRRCMTAEDADFWIRMFSFGATVNRLETGDVIAYANMRPGSLSATSKRSNWWDWYPWSRDREAFPFGASIYGTQNWMPRIWPLDQPQVTVVIPVGPTHATEAVTAVDSVLAQTYRDWDVVLVNDSVHEIPHLPPWVRQFSTPTPGSGVAAARNIGIDQAHTPWVCFLDADDYLTPTALAEMLAVAEHLPDDVPGFIYPDFVAEYGDGRKEVKPLDDWSQERMLAQAVHGITALYPLKAFREGVRFDEDLPGWEDWDLGFQLADHGYCAYHLERPLFVYRMALGQRREENFADKEANKVAIREKWKQYIDGGAQMPCRKCGGRAPAPPSLLTGARHQAPPPSDGPPPVWVDYIGTQGVATSFRPPRSGTEYRFGGQRKGGWVMAADADYFRDRPNDFTVIAQRPTVEDRGAEVVLGADVQHSPTTEPAPPPLPEIPTGEFLLRPDLEALSVDELYTRLRNYGGSPGRMRKEDLVDAVMAYQVRARDEAEAADSIAAARHAAPSDSDRWAGRIPEEAGR